MAHVPIHRRWHAALAALLCLPLIAPTLALAASLQVAPTMLELRPGQEAEALWISNSGTEPVQVQVRLFRWTQSGGADELQPTQALLASPPMQELAAGQRQLIRVMRAGDATPDAQQSYRLIVDEVPAFDPDRTGMQFVLRYSIPVFLQPEGPAPQPRLLAQVIGDGDGMAWIQVSNHGDGYAQLADLAHGASDRPLVVRAGLVGYVLPGQTMQWSLEHPPTRFLESGFSARINGESEQTPLPAAPAPR